MGKCSKYINYAGVLQRNDKTMYSCCILSIHFFRFLSLAQKLKGLVEQYEVREQVNIKELG